MAEISIKFIIRLLVVAFLSLSSFSQARLNQTVTSSVLSQFDRVADDLKKLQTLLSQTATSANAASMQMLRSSLTEKCTLSKDKLKEIEAEFMSDNEENCHVNTNSDEGTCSELFKMIWCNVVDLKSDFERAESKHINLLKRKFNILLVKYSTILDNDDAFVSNHYQTQMHEVKDQMKNLQRSMRAADAKAIDEMTDKIIQDLKTGNVDGAAKTFQETRDLRLDYVYILQNVIDQIYSYDNMEVCISFLTNSAVKDFNGPGYVELFDKMEEKGDLDRLKFVKLRDNAVNDLTGFFGYIEFLEKLKIQYRKVVKINADKMRANNCNELRSFTSTKKQYLEDFIIEATTTDNKIEINNIYECVMSFTNKKDFCYTAMPLIKRMNETDTLDANKLNVFGNKSIEAMKDDDECQLKLSHISDYKVGMAVNNSTADRVCSLRSVLYGGYLFGGNKSYSGHFERHEVYVSVSTFSKPDTAITHPQKWKFEFDSTKQAYKIKNPLNNESLYAAGNDILYDAQRRRVYTANDNKLMNRENYWTIENVGANKVKVKNVRYSEYLIADERGGDDLKNVFTWRSEIKTNYQLFELKCD